MPWERSWNETMGRSTELDAYNSMAEEISQLQGENERLRAALERSVTAIDDWLHLYAPEHCCEDHVKETEKRVNEYGTLWYIADVQRQNRAALSHQQSGESA